MDVSIAQRGMPKTQRANFVKVLENLLQKEQDEEQVSADAAFLHKGVEIFGFDLADGYLTDGPKDYGFDFLNITNESCTIFQSKSINYLNGIDAGFLVGPSYLDDLRQIKEVLQKLDSIPRDCNKEIGAALLALKNEISRRSLQKLANKDEKGVLHTQSRSCSWH